MNTLKNIRAVLIIMIWDFGVASISVFHGCEVVCQTILNADSDTLDKKDKKIK